MRATEIKGLPVAAGERETPGTVTDLILDLDERRVLALQVMVPGIAVEYGLEVADVGGITGEGVQTSPVARILPLTDLPALQPKPTFNWMIRQNVLSENGTLLGKLTDLEIDPATWQVTAFDLVRDYARDFSQGPLRVPANQVLATGRESIIVANAVAGELAGEM